MRVMILTADYPPQPWSGLGVAVERQARALAELEEEVCVVVADRAGRCRDHDPDQQLQVYSLAGGRFPVDPRRFDVVHLHSLPLAGLAEEIHRRFDLPLIYTVHTVIRRELPPSPRTAFWSAVQDRLFALSRTVVFLSAADRRAVVDRLPELAERSVVVPNGLRSPPATPTARAPEEPILVYAGRFAESKGLDLLAAAAPLVLERFPGYLALAGGHGDAAGWRAVHRLRAACPGRCRVLGWLDRKTLDGLFARASLVWVPSRYEPFGLVALEAMRMGAPVLAASVGGLTEVVTAGSGGLLVEGREPDRWAAAALTILGDRELRRRLRRRGPAHVRSRFGVEAMARRLQEVAYAA